MVADAITGLAGGGASANAALQMNPTCDIHEAAGLLKVHHKTVEGLINSGALRAGKVGRAWVLKTADVLDYLDRLIARQTVQPTGRTCVTRRRRRPTSPEPA